MDEHTAEMQSFAYKLKPDAVKRMFEEHVAWHKERMMQGAPPASMEGPAAPKAGGDATQGMQAMAQPPSPEQKIEELLATGRAG